MTRDFGASLCHFEKSCGRRRFHLRLPSRFPHSSLCIETSASTSGVVEAGMGGAPSFVIMGRRCVAITRFMNKKNRQPLYFEQAVDLCRYYHKTVNHPYSVVWSPFHCVYASCICALESLILYVQLKPFWRSHRFIQFARLVFEIESYRRNLLTARTTGE